MIFRIRRGGEDWRPQHLFRVMLAEFILSAMYLFLVTTSSAGGGLKLLEVAFNTGLIIQGCIQCLQHVSGSHFNPAITMMVFSMGLMSLPLAILYVIFQMLGATAGAVLGYYVIPKSISGSYSVLLLHEDVSPQQGVLIEMMGTMFLVIVSVAVTDTDRKVIMPPGAAPLAIGLVMTSVILSVGHLTMGCANPIRAFGPAIATGTWDHHWVYWVGPLLGSFVITLIYRCFFQSTAPKDADSNLSLHQIPDKQPQNNDNP